MLMWKYFYKYKIRVGDLMNEAIFIVNQNKISNEFYPQVFSVVLLQYIE